jgi:hypothetical protein
MLETQFLLINAHFAINLLVALICFAVAWLYFDAWLGRHDIREGTKLLGFFLLSLAFVVHSTQIEQSILESPLLGSATVEYLTNFLKAGGYLILIMGQLIDPLQPLPSYRRSTKERGFGLSNKTQAALIFGSLPLSAIIPFILPLLAGITGFLYVRRATLGLEFHLRTIGYSFNILAISEVLGLSRVFRETSNVDLANLVNPFGVLWILEHIVLIISMVILGKWVWGYLVKRLETQLFMIFTTTTLVIFLLTAVFFTSVSLVNLREDILENLRINVSVLQFSIDGKKAEILSDAQLIAQNMNVVSAINEKDRSALSDLAVTTLIAKKQAFLVIVSSTGEILARGDDPDKIGGSMSDDPLVKRALQGNDVSGIVTREGVMAPSVSIRAAVPVKSGADIIGAAIIGQSIDNAFVDNLKDATGLDASIYGDNVRSATTFVSPDGKSRWVGIKEETAEVERRVLVEGSDFAGGVNILNIPYLAAYTPLKDVDDNPVGMLFVGRPRISTVQAASGLIEQTFMVTVILLVLSIFPAYFVSKYIVDQVKS